MNAAKQLTGRPGTRVGNKPSQPPLQMVNGLPSPAVGASRWWSGRWPLLTALAWAVLLGTVGTWWWLDNNGAAGQASALGSAVQNGQQTSAPQVSRQSDEGLAWTVRQ